MGYTQGYKVNITNYIKILRPKNLALIAISQTIFYYFLILPALENAYLSPQLDIFHFILFVLCTMSIAGAGYVINDLLDIDIDPINKPQQAYIGYGINIRNGWIFYYSVIVFGTILAIYLAWHINKISLLAIYPIATTSLYYYSRSLKSKIFIGNLVVAVFCGFVTAILLLSEPQLIKGYYANIKIKEVTNIIISYSIFGLMINLLREICKDLEDMEGDGSAQLNTMPLVKGINFTKKVFQSILIILITGIFIWGFILTNGDFRSKTFFCIFIIAPLGILFSRMGQAKDKVHYGKISGLLKMVMATAIIYMLLFKSGITI